LEKNKVSEPVTKDKPCLDCKIKSAKKIAPNSDPTQMEKLEKEEDGLKKKATL
jgi:hypothetical protein